MDSSSSSSSRNQNDVVGCSTVVVREAGGGKKKKLGCAWESNEKKPTKLLLNVNIQNGLGPVHVVMSPENTVKDLIKAVMDVYVKEKRRPLLPCTEPHCFQLHFSQFCLEGLEAEEKLENLGSRNFFLRPKPRNSSDSSVANKSSFPLTKLMNYLL